MCAGYRWRVQVYGFSLKHRLPLLSLSEIYISSVHSLLLPHWLLDHQLSFFLFLYTQTHTGPMAMWHWHSAVEYLMGGWVMDPDGCCLKVCVSECAHCMWAAVEIALYSNSTQQVKHQGTQRIISRSNDIYTHSYATLQGTNSSLLHHLHSWKRRSHMTWWGE